MTTRSLLGLLAVAVLVTACAAPTPAPTSASTSEPTRMAASTAEPAGPNPSESAKQACAPDAQREIALSLSLQLTAPITPTWVDHLYSCRYTYDIGSFTLSVKELSDQAATDAYYSSLAPSNGIVLVRKDFKVLRVDATGLPDRFSQPPITRDDAAHRIASDIMACWNGY